MPKNERYIVTFHDIGITDAKVMGTLDRKGHKLADGIKALGAAEAPGETQIMNFPDIGSCSVSLTTKQAQDLAKKRGVAEVVEDIEVFAHGSETDCGCGGTAAWETEAEAGSDPFQEGYQQAMMDILSSGEGGSQRGEVETGEAAAPRPPFRFPWPRPCPPGTRRRCFRPAPWLPPFCFCMPGGIIRRQPIPWNIRLVRADRVWQRVTGARAKVAIIDTGIDNNHPDLSVSGGASFVPGVSDWNDDQGHGTHCAGIVGARNNATGVVGVAPGCSLHAVKVLNSAGSGRLSWILAGMGWAKQQGMHVASLSLGSGDSSAAVACILAYQRAAQGLIDNGCLVVSSAGNSGSSSRPWVGQPARCPGFMAVAAVDRNRNLANFSSRGPAGLGPLQGVEISAPGVRVNSTYVGGGYRELSGTSMSCPHVSGAAALLKELHPTWSPSQIRTRLKNTATDLGTPGDDPGTGAGLLDCHRAVFG